MYHLFTWMWYVDLWKRCKKQITNITRDVAPQTSWKHHNVEEKSTTCLERKDHNLVICKDGKGTGTTMMNSTEKEFVPLTNTLTSKFQNIITQGLKNSNYNSPSISSKNWIHNLVYYALCPHFRKIALKSVTLHCQPSYYIICWKLAEILSTLVRFKTTRAVKTSLDLIYKLQNQIFPQKTTDAFFDVSNLFCSMLTQESVM